MYLGRVISNMGLGKDSIEGGGERKMSSNQHLLTSAHRKHRSVLVVASTCLKAKDECSEEKGKEHCLPHGTWPPTAWREVMPRSALARVEKGGIVPDPLQSR